MPLYPGRLHHGIPHWAPSGAKYHIRLRIHPSWQGRLDALETADALISAAKNYHDRGLWWCTLFLLMPDHLHGMFTFPPDKGMSQTFRDWKRGTAKALGIKWQPNYFDHRLRSGKESDETWDYIRANPVRAHLCAAPADWPRWWSALSPTRYSVPQTNPTKQLRRVLVDQRI